MKLKQNLFLETERLLLVPMTFEFVSKILDGDPALYEEFGIKPIDEWPRIDLIEILPILKDKLSTKPIPDGFEAWLFVDKLDHSIIGDGGFKGPPDENGVLDIGYGIIESRRRQGFAFEAVTALVKWGLSHNNVKAITADCLKNNIPSINLLKKLGMVEIRQDDELIYFALNQF